MWNDDGLWMPIFDGLWMPIPDGLPGSGLTLMMGERTNGKQSKKANFDASHELEELLLEDNPLKAKARKGRDINTLSAEMRQMEEQCVFLFLLLLFCCVSFRYVSSDVRFPFRSVFTTRGVPSFVLMFWTSAPVLDVGDPIN